MNGRTASACLLGAAVLAGCGGGGPAEPSEEEHLPGAISIPLARLGREAADRLRRERPIVVYCWDSA